MDFQGEGLSILEISHRAKYFQPVMDEAETLVKELLNVPEGYKTTTDTTFWIDEHGTVHTTGTVNHEGVILIKDDYKTTDLTIRKVWKDEGNRDGKRPLTLSVKLKADGVEAGI